MITKINSVADIAIAQQNVINIIEAVCAFIKEDMLRQFKGMVLKEYNSYFEVTDAIVKPSKVSCDGNFGDMFNVTFKGYHIKLNRTDDGDTYSQWSGTMRIIVIVKDGELTIWTNAKSVTREWMLDAMKRYNAKAKYIKAFKERTLAAA